MDALRGIALLWRTPRLWGLSLAPQGLALLVYALVGVAGWYLAAPALRGFLGRFGEGWATLGPIALAVAWLLIFPFLYLLLASAFVGLVFDPLARAVEAMQGEAPEAVSLPFPRLLRDTLARLALNAGLGVAAFLLGFVLGPIPGILAAGLIGLLDYTAPAFLRRGRPLGEQARQLLGAPDGSTIGFGIVAGLLSLVPLLGVLLAPGLVAGGTLLARRRLAALSVADEPSSDGEP